jgi:hypothetical protein
MKRSSRERLMGSCSPEWKVATPKDALSKYAEARAQADLYKQGPLAGIELTGYRYLIAVSENELPPTSVPADDRTPQGIEYRHINIVVDPGVPSKAARSAVRRSAAGVT